MSLEIDKIAKQVEDLAKDISQGKEELGKALKLAWESFSKLGTEQEALKQKLKSARTTWLIAEPLENLDSFPIGQPPPADYSAIAVDGSHLAAERYSPRPYFLINLGVCILSYGTKPDAELFSTPRLYFKPEEIAIRDPAGKEREMPVEAALLGVKRQVEEAAYLAAIAGDYKNNSGPVLALLDGSLILWGLEAQKLPDFVHHALLEEGLLRALGKMQNAKCKMQNAEDGSIGVSPVDAEEGKQQIVDSRQQAVRAWRAGPSGQEVVIASYISATGSTDVANLLRLYLCPHEPVNCDKYCREKASGTRECDALAGVNDRGLFSELLKPGQRSPLFGSNSSIMKYYGEHRVCFFYLRLEEEVARVEMPGWLTKREKALDLVHSLVYDQCQRGLGYPVALSEAHERAVLRAEDRELFHSVLEQICLEKNLTLPLSAKDSSKRTRWI